MTGGIAAAAVQRNIFERIDGEGYSAEIFRSPYNQRIQVLRYEADDFVAMALDLKAMALAEGFGKVFFKAPLGDRSALEAAGMESEATIDGYFRGEPAIVMSSFLNDERRRRPHLDQQAEILETVRRQPGRGKAAELPEGYRMAVAVPEDCEPLARLYAEVFASYPFPITDPGYLRSTMADNVLYRLVRDADGELVGVASAEMNPDLANAEMTDFATLPSQRGLGLAQHILGALEADMADRSVWNLYTIARARSAGMNRVFANRGYRWTGTLVNNCHIAGQFEDMHIWCKSIAPDA